MRMEMTWLHHVALSSSTGDAHIFSETARDEACVCDCPRSVQDDKRPSYIHQTHRHTPACVRPQRRPVLPITRGSHTRIFSCVCVCAQRNAFNMHIYDGETSETHTQSAGESFNWAERRGEGQRDELFNATATKWINKQMKREMASASTTPTPDNKHLPATVSTHSQTTTDSYTDNICCSSHEESIATTRHGALFIIWYLQAYLYATKAVWATHLNNAYN